MYHSIDACFSQMLSSLTVFRLKFCTHFSSHPALIFVLFISCLEQMKRISDLVCVISKSTSVGRFWSTLCHLRWFGVGLYPYETVLVNSLFLEYGLVYITFTFILWSFLLSRISILILITCHSLRFRSALQQCRLGRPEHLYVERNLYLTFAYMTITSE